MDRRTPIALVAVIGLALTLATGGALAAGDGSAAFSQTNETEANETEADDANGTVSIGTGAQLATIVTAVETRFRADYETTAFELAVESEGDAERAEAVTERYERLRDRATEIREQYQDATEAYRSGEISRKEYAQRVATLNARAESVAGSLQQLRNRTASLSNATRSQAGVNVSEINATATTLEDVTSAGPSALLERYTGSTTGEVAIESSNGVSIEVESEEGKTVREFERDADENASVALNRSDARQIARDRLTDRAGWTLAESEFDRDDGVYSFEFTLETANETGSAEVSVDAGDGRVLSLEEEIESRDDESDEERDADERESDESETDEPETEEVETEGPETEDVETEEPETEETEEVDTEDVETEEPEIEETEEPETEEVETEEPETDEIDTDEPETEETDEQETEETDEQETEETDEQETEEVDTDEPETETTETATSTDTATPTPSVALSRSEAIDTARGELPEYETSWSVDRAELDRDDAEYRIEFAYENETISGDVDVRIDADSGAVLDTDEDIDRDSDD